MQQPLAVTPTLPPRAPSTPKVSPKRAWWVLWLTLFVLVVGVGVGGSWDKVWHSFYSFDGFWSPPHLFVYACSTLAAFMIGGMVLTGRIRRTFGPGFRLWRWPFEVPGALVILVGGIVLLGFAGMVLDNLWHSSFGLDETNWSFPHAMIGWAGLVVILGFVACRLALRRYKPPGWHTVLLLGILIMFFSPGPLMGPIEGNRTKETTQAVSQIPALAAQPAAQNSYRIQQEWNLNRTNPLLMLLAPVWAGAALAFLRKLDRRAWLLLLIVFLWSLNDSARNSIDFLSNFATLTENPANWRELPILLPAIGLLVGLRLGLPELWAWTGAGFLFGLLIYSIWGTQPVFLLLAFGSAFAMLAGKYLGERVWAIVEKPYTLRTVLPILIAGVAVPFTTGLLDLYLRFS